MNTRPDIRGIWHNAEPWERVFAVIVVVALAALVGAA